MYRRDFYMQTSFSDNSGNFIMDGSDLPYRAEYAKSSRAKCKACKDVISKDALRLAAMVQSPMFDGKVPNWYHQKCFFLKQRPVSVADIAHFDLLRYSDQQKVKDALEKAVSAVPLKGRGKSKALFAASTSTPEQKEFSVEIAQAGRAGCKGCDLKILKGEIRISKMDYTSESARRYGPMQRWHHLECFTQLRSELGWYDSAKELPGFYALPIDVQQQLSTAITAIKRKAEDEVDSKPVVKKVKKEDEKIMKKQNDVLFKFRDQLKALAKLELVELLEHNIPSFNSHGLGESELLDRAADYLSFGVPEACSVCQGFLVYRSGVGYACTGNITEFTSCVNVVKVPQRTPFSVPAELALKFSFLSKYKDPKLGDRLFVDLGDRTSTSRQQSDKPLCAPIKRPGKPLRGLSFVVHPEAVFTSVGSSSELKKVLEGLGATLTATVTKNTAALFSTAEGVLSEDKYITKAKKLGVQCVAENYLEEIKTSPDSAIVLIKKLAISGWGDDPEQRVTKSKLYSSVNKSVSSAGSRYTQDVPDKVKLQLKDGGAVDTQSGLHLSTHVLKHDGKLYSSVLSYVDVMKGTNSYYKLQLLEDDKINSWWVFRSWGRIGTNLGNTKLEHFSERSSAMRHYKQLFEEKTGNCFTNDKFTKLAHKWNLLDIEYDVDEETKSLTVSTSDSKLPVPVQELVKLIFDVDAMKYQMLEFEIDLKKLPLGKLSERQLLSAYSVLTEVQQLLSEDIKSCGPRILDCSNRFYTLIPHDFGMNKAPLLDNLDLIKSKVEMVESLREIEVAYRLLKTEGGASSEETPAIDLHYEKLKTKLEVLPEDSEEFKILQQYVVNTHAATHSHYKLQIQTIFRVERQGEAKRFKPFKKLHNHKLLWHGSRITNYAGILSQGLRIAPPEAPSTGYMFGKGVYFADMVSKSANYCGVSGVNSTGLLLLCDVALGNMEKKTRAEFVTKLTGGKHSTMGCGRTYPDPDGSKFLDGIEVPLAKPKEDPSVKSSLLYNEYIVYDVAQVNVKYLMQLKFVFDS
ncbi:PADR1 domain [Trinorchestia longiramus]|nr:PADR1 domain [Trinorchestia longiramus]